MLEIIIQLLVAVLATLTAGLKGLHFSVSNVTDYELQRRLKAGNAEAQREQQLRDNRALLDALRRLVVLVLTVVIVIILGTSHSFVVAVLYALAWLLVIELLTARKLVSGYAERFASQYQDQLVRAAITLRPLLQLLVDNQVLGHSQGTAYFSKEELLQAIDGDKTVLDREEKLLVRQALSYRAMLVGDIMTPRSVVVTVGVDDTIGPLLLDRLHKTGHSRFPVTGGDDLDHVQGVLYMHNLVPLDPKLKKVRDAMTRKAFFVHQDKPLDHVLHAFLRTKHHLFMVVNEFEEVTGVISIEDVLEAIIGRKIVDEFDQYEDLRAVARLVATERRKARSDQS